ncbi:unnamed protein product, partial [Chrysoparadoxa australica]
MAFVVITSQNTTQTVYDTDIFTLMPGSTLTAPGDAIDFDGVTFTEATVNILGTVVAGDIGVDAFTSLPAIGAANNITVRIGAEGAIFARDFALKFEDGDNIKVLNEGTM